MNLIKSGPFYSPARQLEGRSDGNGVVWCRVNAHFILTIFIPTIYIASLVQVLLIEINREPRENRGRARRCDRGRKLQDATGRKVGKAQPVGRSGSQKTCLYKKRTQLRGWICVLWLILDKKGISRIDDFDPGFFLGPSWSNTNIFDNTCHYADGFLSPPRTRVVGMDWRI
jgi:hypothetical protein